MEEQIRTQLALPLGDRQYDTILSDASPEFTEDRQEDGDKIVKLAYEIFVFSNLFLKKGGNIVLKVLHSDAADFLHGTSRIN